MISPLTENTQAILLLTAPLLAGKQVESHELLSLGDYNRLVRHLREKQKQPADLIGVDAEELLRSSGEIFGRARLETLLGRGFLLSQALDRWHARSIWVVSRADTTYPRRIKARLREEAPPVLYGCGDASLLDCGGLAVVGSRHVDDDLISDTENVGRLAAAAGKGVVSGGAKGIDRAAMHGALETGGVVMGVMADSLERAALARDNREPLMEGRLVLISPYDPSAGFNVGHAMKRNRIIYALADAALVVTSDFKKGGTWAGAIEQLEQLRYVPVFVRNGLNSGKGNAALIQHGGMPWPNPTDHHALKDALAAAVASQAAEPKQDILSFAVKEESPARAVEATEGFPGESTRTERASASERLFDAVREIVKDELADARSEEEVAELLGVPKGLAKKWIAQLVKESLLEKLSKPVRYRAFQRLL